MLRVRDHLHRQVARDWMQRITSNKKAPSLAKAPTYVRDDRDCIIAAIRRDHRDCQQEGITKNECLRGHAVKYASDRLRDCPDVIVAAIELRGMNVRYASDRLKCEPSIRSAAMGEPPQHPSIRRGKCRMRRRQTNRRKRIRLIIEEPAKRQRREQLDERLRIAGEGVDIE